MEKIRVTQQQRDNAIEARDVMWPSVPEANVADKLGDWTADNSDRTYCGTVACFGGWCARWPAFREQGARLDSGGEPYMETDKSDFYSWPAMQMGADLFGDSEVFKWRLDHERGTDHEIVTKRLDKLIRNSVVAK